MAGFLFRKHLYICLINTFIGFIWKRDALCCEMWGIFCLRCTKISNN